jgi:hypothetical protein
MKRTRFQSETGGGKQTTFKLRDHGEMEQRCEPRSDRQRRIGGCLNGSGFTYRGESRVGSLGVESRRIKRNSGGSLSLEWHRDTVAEVSAGKGERPREDLSTPHLRTPHLRTSALRTPHLRKAPPGTRRSIGALRGAFCISGIRGIRLRPERRLPSSRGCRSVCNGC